MPIADTTKNSRIDASKTSVLFQLNILGISGDCFQTGLFTWKNEGVKNQQTNRKYPRKVRIEDGRGQIGTKIKSGRIFDIINIKQRCCSLLAEISAAEPGQQSNWAVSLLINKMGI